MRIFIDANRSGGVRVDLDREAAGRFADAYMAFIQLVTKAQEVVNRDRVRSFMEGADAARRRARRKRGK